MRKPKFKDSHMNLIVDACIAGFIDKNSEFYHDGKPRRSASHRCYFWNGYEGNGHHSGTGTLGHAAYRAGQYCKAKYN